MFKLYRLEEDSILILDTFFCSNIPHDATKISTNKFTFTPTKIQFSTPHTRLIFVYILPLRLAFFLVWRKQDFKVRWSGTRSYYSGEKIKWWCCLCLPIVIHSISHRLRTRCEIGDWNVLIEFAVWVILRNWISWKHYWYARNILK